MNADVRVQISGDQALLLGAIGPRYWNTVVTYTVEEFGLKEIELIDARKRRNKISIWEIMTLKSSSNDDHKIGNNNAFSPERNRGNSGGDCNAREDDKDIRKRYM